MRAFKGVRVIDFSRVLSGPVAAQMLGLLDADVIKVEPTGDGDQLRGVLTDPEMAAKRMSPAFLTVNLNKRSIALDLKSDAGRAAAAKLVENADVVVENFVPGVAAKLGIDYESVRAANPNVVYCSISGYGQNGPKSGERAYDVAVQADSGMMTLTGHPETGPTRVGFMLIDMTTGISAAYAIASALYRRAVTGQGQYLDVAMYDTALQMMSCQAADYMMRGNHPGLLGNGSPTAQPTAGAFETSDGILLLATLTSAQQEGCFRALGLEESLLDPRYSTEPARQENFKTGLALIQAAMKSRTTEEWLPILKKHGVAVQAVRDLDTSLSDPQLAHRGILVDASGSGLKEKTDLIGAPFLANEDGPLQEATAPVTVGQDTREVLEELGCTPDEIDAILDSVNT
ncbi:CoA transferase [Nisaea sp.]|uniref:CaiB/BaiF CoA transferase family protein n=1 Tax=Nisaea sp. TaxID=2024842 RepID=UPI00329A0DB9